MQEPVEITYGMVASGSKRLINCILDTIVVTFIQIALAQIFNLLYQTYGHEFFMIGRPEMGNVKYTMFGLGINIVYYGLFESLCMRTAGKYVTNTKVVNRDGTTPDNGTILIRTLCRLIPFEFLSFILRKPAIGWHDSFSKTLVVDIAAFAHAKRMNELKDIANKEEKENYD